MCGTAVDSNGLRCRTRRGKLPGANPGTSTQKRTPQWRRGSVRSTPTDSESVSVGTFASSNLVAATKITQWKRGTEATPRRLGRRAEGLNSRVQLAPFPLKNECMPGWLSGRRRAVANRVRGESFSSGSNPDPGAQKRTICRRAGTVTAPAGNGVCPCGEQVRLLSATPTMSGWQSGLMYPPRKRARGNSPLVRIQLPTLADVPEWINGLVLKTSAGKLASGSNPDVGANRMDV